MLRRHCSPGTEGRELRSTRKADTELRNVNRMCSSVPLRKGQRTVLMSRVAALLGALAAAACDRDFEKASSPIAENSPDAAPLDGGGTVSSASSSLDDSSTGASALGPLTSISETSTETHGPTAQHESTGSGASVVEAGPADASVTALDAGDGGRTDDSTAQCSRNAPDGAPDTDGDAEADVDDTDDDDDGIPDAEDADPLDPAVPGGSEACGPAVVMNDPCMRQALDMTKELVDFPVHLEHCGLDISGYYLRPDGSGEVVTDNNGSPRGNLIGGEYRFTQTGELVQVAEVAFTNGIATGHSKSSWPSWVRGSRHGSSTFGCDPSSGGISSGRTREDGGIADVWTLSVARAPLGSDVCPENSPWTLSFQSVLLRVAPHELDYMCSADGAAYIPSETWDGESGVCTCQDDLDVICSSN